MCGIVGYTGKKHTAKSVLITGLKNLEYRGYDSCGVALNENNKINLYKATGRIMNLEKLLEKNTLNSQTGIGHTRWATHGIPNEINAHPHKCGDVTLVHNGIIENYAELKNFLISKGVIFKTQTDSEVACAYINYIYQIQKKNNNTDKIDCLISSCDKFRGSYAFAIIFDDEPNTVYATRKDSPLIVGIGEDENFASSDITAILDYTNKYILLEAGEFAQIQKDSVHIYDIHHKLIEKKINIANWDKTSYQKNGYEHFMLKEIMEQPKVLENIFIRYFKNNTYDQNIDLSKYDTIDIVACGSAMHAGLIGKYLFETYANTKVNVEVASEYRYKNNFINDKTLVIIISQSGETADSIAALRLAKQSGAFVLAIVNVVGSTISREADCTIYTYAGPEIAVATTKGYSSQVAILSSLAFNLAKQKKLIDSEEIKKVETEYSTISTFISNTIDKKDLYSTVAEKIYNKEDLFYIGRGIDYAICMEGSLKLKEISYMHSEAYPAGELKHGTISLIEKDTPVIAIATDEKLFEKTVSNIKETKARGSFVIFITTENLYNKFISQKNDYSFYDIVVILPTATLFIQALIAAVAVQLIGYETAKLRKCDIDKPRNLAKSVTVE